MTVAQTTQLIQLILNSALMMVLAMAWWGVVWLRFNAIVSELRHQERQYQVQLRAAAIAGQPWPRRRSHRHQLRVRYRLNRHSMLTMHYVLLALAGSLLGLGLRMLISGDWLIALALVLFVLAAVGLLCSVALALLEFYQLSGLETVANGVESRPSAASQHHRSSAGSGPADILAS